MASLEEELKHLKNEEYSMYLDVLLKEKEIDLLKSQIADVDEQISINKSAYSTVDPSAALRHPLVNKEFELTSQMLKKLYEDLALYAPIEQDAEMGENGTIKMLTNQNRALERENRHAEEETNDAAIKKLENEMSS